MNDSFWGNFILCGIIGWTSECTFTGICSLLQKDPLLQSTSSLWMFPIYGCAAFLLPLIRYIRDFPWFLRGTIYMLCFFSGEYIFGRLLQGIHACPWDYSSNLLSLQGVVRLDFIPAWFLLGLLYEKVLLHSDSLL